MDVLIPPSIVYATLWGAAVLAAVLLVAVFAVRATRTLRASHAARVLAPLADDLLAVAAGEDPTGESAARLAAVPGRHRRALERAIVSRLEFVRGTPGRALTDILETWGVRESWSRQCRSFSATRRALAVTDLGLLHDAALTDVVLPLLRDRNVRVRTSAVRALGRFRSPEGVGSILDAIAPGPRGNLPPWVVMDAIAFPGAECAVRDALCHAAPQVRAVAAHAVTLRGWPSAAPQLRRALASEDDPPTRALQARALGAVGSDRDTELLMALTGTGEDRAVRIAGIEALAEVGAEHGLLGELLLDKDPSVGRAAAAALGRMGDSGRLILDEAFEPTPVVLQEMALSALRAPASRPMLPAGQA